MWVSSDLYGQRLGVNLASSPLLNAKSCDRQPKALIAAPGRLYRDRTLIALTQPTGNSSLCYPMPLWHLAIAEPCSLRYPIRTANSVMTFLNESCGLVGHKASLITMYKGGNNSIQLHCQHLCLDLGVALLQRN